MTIIPATRRTKTFGQIHRDKVLKRGHAVREEVATVTYPLENPQLILASEMQLAH